MNHFRVEQVAPPTRCPLAPLRPSDPFPPSWIQVLFRARSSSCCSTTWALTLCWSQNKLKSASRPEASRWQENQWSSDGAVSAPDWTECKLIWNQTVNQLMKKTIISSSSSDPEWNEELQHEQQQHKHGATDWDVDRWSRWRGDMISTLQTEYKWKYCWLLSEKENDVIRHTHTPHSLLWVSEGLSQSGEVRVEVDRRRDDLQQTWLDLCRKTDTWRRSWFVDTVCSCLLWQMACCQHKPRWNCAVLS